MKKGVGIFCIFALMLVLSFQFVLSASNETEDYKITQAYQCLNKNVVDKNCSKLSLDEKIFASLAIKKCNTEIRSASLNSEQCWPASGCNIKTTAQAILALHNSGINTDKAEDWLLSQNATPQDLDWFLQVDSPNPTQCKISYSGRDYLVIIGSDKKINSGAGTCLTLDTNGYWLKIASSCLDREFTISCNESFLTSLLFKKKTSTTINVLENSHSASENGYTIEQITSSCFKQSGSCNYEGTLWATFVLKSLDYDVSNYMPYLTSMSDENEKVLPESFLYSLTASTDFYTSLMLKQKSGYWEESGNRYYDTAMALYPLKYDESQNKQTAVSWLLKNQDKDYCWESGNIKDTAWILYSIWPRAVSFSDSGTATNVVEEDDCEDAGNFCMLESECSGKILSNFSCPSYYKCCDTEKEVQSCSDQGGKICTSNQDCFGGTTLEASDLLYGQSCCVDGSCQASTQTEEATCESSGGTCSEVCDSGYYESSSDTCDISTDVCCVKSKTKLSIWFWVLLVLVVLVALAIVFRDKLAIMFMKFKSGKGKRPGEGGSKPTSPSPFLRQPVMRTSPRRILPNTDETTHQVRRPEKKNEIDEVLKKLKDMSK